MIKNPTRESSLLDLAIVQSSSLDSYNTVTNITNDFPSDHIPLIMNVSQKNVKLKSNSFYIREVRNFDLLDSDTLRSELSASSLTDMDILDRINLDECIMLYNQTISNIVDKFCPIQPKRIKFDQSKRWYNNELTI